MNYMDSLLIAARKAIATPTVPTEDYPDLLQQVRAHIKSHKLFNWDEALTGYEMELLEDLLLTFSPKLRPGTVGNPMPATEESNLREAAVELIKRYPDFKYEGITGPISALRARQIIELRRKDFIAGAEWEAARKALASDKFTRQDMEGVLEWFGRKYNDEFRLIGKDTYCCHTGHSITTSQLIDEYIKQKV